MNNDQSKSAENEKVKQEEDLEDRIMKEIKEHPDRNHFFVDMILQFLFDLLHRNLLRWQWVIDKKIKGLCWIACFVKSEHKDRSHFFVAPVFSCPSTIGIQIPVRSTDEICFRLTKKSHDRS